MKRPETTHIIVHTAAWPGDPSAADIRRVHVKENGWDDIGYHYVVRKNGDIEAGRAIYKVGAHCKAQGMNKKSIGICLSGHHDHEFLKGPQREALLDLLLELIFEYEIDPSQVQGHRETGADKTCPGVLVDMDELRLELMALNDDRLIKDTLKKTAVFNPEPISDLKDIEYNLNGARVPITPVTDPNDFKVPLHKKVSRFIKNSKAGKVLTAGVITAVGLLTGINLNELNPSSNMEFIEAIPLDIIIEYVLIPVLLFMVGLFIRKPGTQQFIEDKIEAAAPVIVASVDEKSEGGKRITSNEVKAILSSIFKKNTN